jgi:DNA-binding protein HU-beta
MARKAVKKAVKKSGRKAPARKAVAKKAAASSKVMKSPAPAKALKVVATAGATVTAGALLQSVADHLGVSKAEAKAIVEGYTDVVKAYVLKGAKVKIGDIGMIMIRHRKARMGRNPATGEAIKIKASKKLAFRQSAVMKAAVMGGK